MTHRNKKFKYLAILGFASFCLLASPCFALTTQTVPTDTHGAALADPDEKFDNMNDPLQNNRGMQFGGGSVWLQNSPAAQNTVQTGAQLFDATGYLGNRH